MSPSNLNNIQAYLVTILAEDIHQMCNQNSIRIQEIIEVYNLEKIPKSKSIQQIIPSLIREVRQVVVGSIIAAVGVMTSLVSIFTSNELMNMSSADDTDEELIDKSNNIIKTLQAHENAINRDEAGIKEMKKHIDKLENTISLEKKAKRQSQIKKNTLINPHGSGRPSGTNVSDSNTTRVSVLQYDELIFNF